LLNPGAVARKANKGEKTGTVKLLKKSESNTPERPTGPAKNGSRFMLTANLPDNRRQHFQPLILIFLVLYWKFLVVVLSRSDWKSVEDPR
jgi:hypothetical protein